MASSNIPEKTIERLSEYRRTLLSCHKQGITHIFSHVLAGIHGITAVQVRRDLMLIGFSSDTKKGYDVKVLIDFISNILDSDTVTNIAVIGMGHLGQAITKYFNGRGLKLKITTAFDIDPAKVGQTIDGIPCHHMETFEEVVEDKDIDIVIVSSPSRVADELVVPIVNAGIKGVLNFTSRPLNFPRGIVVENYDITTLLEKGAYFVQENEENPTESTGSPHSATRRLPSDRSTAYTAVTASCSRPCAASPANATAKVSSSHSRPTRASYSKHRPICACSRRSTRRPGCSNGPASTIWSSSLSPANSAGRVPPISSAAT